MADTRNFKCPVTDELCERADCRLNRCLDQVEANASKTAEALARDRRVKSVNDLYSLIDKPPMKN